MNKKILFKLLVLCNVVSIYAAQKDDETFSRASGGLSDSDDDISVVIGADPEKASEIASKHCKVVGCNPVVLDNSINPGSDAFDESDESEEDEETEDESRCSVLDSLEHEKSEAEVSEPKTLDQRLHEEVMPKMYVDHFKLLNDTTYFDDYHWADWHDVVKKDVEYLMRIQTNLQSALRAQEVQLDERKENVQNILDSINGDKEDQKKAYRNHIKTIRAEVRAQERQLREFEESCDRIKEQAENEYRQICKTGQNELESLKNKTQKYLNGIQVFIAERTKWIDETMDKVQVLDKNVKNTTSKYNDLKCQYDGKVAVKANSSSEKLEREISDLSGKMIEAKSKMDEANNANNAAKPGLLANVTKFQKEIEQLRAASEKKITEFNNLYNNTERQILDRNAKALEEKDNKVAQQSDKYADAAAATAKIISGYKDSITQQRAKIMDVKDAALELRLDSNHKDIINAEQKIISIRRAIRCVDKKLNRSNVVKNKIDSLLKFREEKFADSLHAYTLNPKRRSHRLVLRRSYAMIGKMYDLANTLYAYDMISREHHRIYISNIRMYKKCLNNFLLLGGRSSFDRRLVLLGEYLLLYKRNMRPDNILRYKELDAEGFDMGLAPSQMFLSFIYQVRDRTSILDDENITEVDRSLPPFMIMEVRNTLVDRLSAGDKKANIFSESSKKFLKDAAEKYNQKREQDKLLGSRRAEELGKQLRTKYHANSITPEQFEEEVKSMSAGDRNNPVVMAELKTQLNVVESQEQKQTKNDEMARARKEKASATLADLDQPVEKVLFKEDEECSEDYDDPAVGVSSSDSDMVQDNAIPDKIMNYGTVGVFAQCATKFLTVNDVWDISSGLIFKVDRSARIFSPYAYMPVFVGPIFGIYHSKWKAGVDMSLCGKFWGSKYLNLEIRLRLPLYIPIMVSFVFDKCLRPAIRVGGAYSGDYTVTQVSGWRIPLDLGVGGFVGMSTFNQNPSSNLTS